MLFKPASYTASQVVPPSVDLKIFDEGARAQSFDN
jgi:hypothetical protein